MDITVRDAGPADMDAIRAVMSAATAQLRRVYRPSPHQLARAKVQEVRWLVAEIAGRAVGALRIAARPESLHVGVGVHPEFQRNGIARLLIETLARQAVLAGTPKLTLETVKETGNVPIFARLGFAVVGEEPDTDSESVNGQPLTNVRMERHL